MKKNLFLIISAFMFKMQSAYGVSSNISSDLRNSLKSAPCDISGVSVVFSLIFVVLLIYITGIIYQKLNVFGAKKVKEQFRNADLNKIVVVSTTQIGQHRSLHVIELNNKRYLIGSAPNSISLIKELDNPASKNIQEPVKKSKDENEDGEIEKAIQVLYGGSSEEIIDDDNDSENEEFNIHKKYL